jgi:hypothetical protein
MYTPSLRHQLHRFLEGVLPAVLSLEIPVQTRRYAPYRISSRGDSSVAPSANVFTALTFSRQAHLTRRPIFKISRAVCQAFQWPVCHAVQPPETRSLLEISSISSSHNEDSGSLVIVLPVIKIAIVKNHAVVSNVVFRLKIGG